MKLRAPVTLIVQHGELCVIDVQKDCEEPNVLEEGLVQVRPVPVSVIQRRGTVLHANTLCRRLLARQLSTEMSQPLMVHTCQVGEDEAN